MKLQALFLSLAISAAQGAPSFENLKSLPWDISLPRFEFKASPPAPALLHKKLFQDPRLSPLPPFEKTGEVIGRVDLAPQLDRHRALMTATLGRSRWEIGLASDAGVNTYFLTFRQGTRLKIAPLGAFSRLRGSGIDVEIEPGVVYNLKLSINIFSPVRGSTVKIRPARGTQGPNNDISTGALLDSARAHASLFRDGSDEYWTFYGTDVDPATGQLGSSHTFLFVHFDGLDSKAWPMTEAVLPVGQPMLASLLDPLKITRGDTELTIAR